MSTKGPSFDKQVGRKANVFHELISTSGAHLDVYQNSWNQTHQHKRSAMDFNKQPARKDMVKYGSATSIDFMPTKSSLAKASPSHKSSILFVKMKERDSKLYR